MVDQHCGVPAWRGGLTVVDASVMLGITRANTNATITLIGERVADLIREGR